MKNEPVSAWPPTSVISARGSLVGHPIGYVWFAQSTARRSTVGGPVVVVDGATVVVVGGATAVIVVVVVDGGTVVVVVVVVDGGTVVVDV